VLERDVEEGSAGLGEELSAVVELPLHVDAPPAAVRDSGRDGQVAVDERRLPVADEHPSRHCREAVPGGEQPARFVERRSDEPSVDNPGAGLVPFGEGKGRLVALQPLLCGQRQVDAVGIGTATPARGVMVRRYPFYRRPPRSKCAL
jgi:hypothetical protein